MNAKRLAVRVTLILIFFAGPGLGQQSDAPGLEATAFGLRHTVVSNAYLTFNSSGTLLVDQRLNSPLSGVFSGSTTPFAIDIDLGQADSGLFVYPNSYDHPQNNHALEGWAIGRTTNDIEGMLSGVSAYRRDWGQYEVEVDFSPLGASRYRYELYCDGYMVGEADHLPGNFLISTYDVESSDPRANPLHRLPDGRMAAVVEFPSPTLFVVTNGFRAGGNRLLVIPEDLTNDFSHVSRVRVIGSGGLQIYEVQDERPVFFGAPHRALGSALFETNAAGFTMGNIDDEGDAGVLIEGNRCAYIAADMAGMHLSLPDQEFSWGGSGSSSLDSFATFLGPVGFTYADEAWRLYFVDISPTGFYRVLIESSTAGVPTGQEEVETDYRVGFFATNALHLTRVGGFGVAYTNLGGFFFSLAEPVTLTTSASNQLTGDTFFVRLANPIEHLGALSSLNLMGANLGEITIIDELRLELPPPPLSLAITPTSPEQITVDWPHFPCNCYHLWAVTNLNGISGIPERSTTYEDFHQRTSVDTGLHPESYFRLLYRYGRYAW